jgi:hypothetical protein
MKGTRMMIYELKHFDTTIIKFSLEHEALKGIVCKIIWSDDTKKDYFPIGVQATDDSVLSWLKSRTVPKNRGYVEALLASMNLAENDLIGVLNICKGLSLNDSYWVVEEGFDGAFSDYNLYDNKFLTALSLIAYTGYGSVKAKGFTSSPEFTTNGMLRKGWRRFGDKIYLYKGGTQGASNTGNEPYSEYYACEIAKAMGLNHITYTLSSWKKSVCSVCELFTSKDISYVPIWRFGEFRTVVDVSNYLKSLGDDFYNDFVDMMIFDALIYNTDRHQGNFGLLVDSHTNKPISLAPIFDNGLGLFPYAVTDDLKNISSYAKTRDSAFEISFDEIAKAYITDRQKAQLRKVLDFSFTLDKNYNLPAKRVKIIEKFIRERASEILTI